MSHVKKIAKEIITGIDRIIEKVSDEEINRILNVLLNARDDKKILIIGTGRSGFVGKCFALRLMHLGFNVYVAGETITPALKKEDLVIAISGSGTTRTVVTQAEVAKEIGAKVIAITSRPESPLGRISDLVVVVKGRTKIAKEEDYVSRQMMGEHEPLAPLGTMFELSTMIFLDCLIAELMNRMGEREDDLRKRHAVIE
ncbi:6-phospho-3-hexuloisomerase [Candidatus Bathyarchaeota archaeon]|nr:MAG: 6-phospho-3-hexuloisomerase [Candidatus Bathyarchaeota archaeon]